jgi:hypothetical protein
VFTPYVAKTLHPHSQQGFRRTQIGGKMPLTMRHRRRTELRHWQSPLRTRWNSLFPPRPFLHSSCLQFQSRLLLLESARFCRIFAYFVSIFWADWVWCLKEGSNLTHSSAFAHLGSAAAYSSSEGTRIGSCRLISHRLIEGRAVQRSKRSKRSGGCLPHWH